MTPADIRVLLRDPSEIENNAFRLASEIARTLGGEDSNEGHELLLRAQEQRQHFGEAAVVLDSCRRKVGLFPYVERAHLGLADSIALECHRPGAMEDFVFHTLQARVYYKLLAGRSVVLSAPTSFGKSAIIDAIVASEKYANIVVVVPTLALVDETRRRLSRFRSRYRILTHPSQKIGKRNVHVLTQERVIDHPGLSRVDFFVIDEFYKIDPAASPGDERSDLLNQAFYKLFKKCKLFYMLGPGIREVAAGVGLRMECDFHYETFSTVVSELHQVDPGSDKLMALRELCASLSGPTIVFCSSPDHAAQVAETLAEDMSEPSKSLRDASNWVAEHYHPEWHFTRCLRSGIGIHHGRIPRALAQFVVKAFNEGTLGVLVCTSTLVEGVNTRAKNIVLFDDSINRRKLDLFTFNNIRGRAGRMFRHFVGHVYVFGSVPSENPDRLPIVDVPAVTQSEAASETLLLHMDRQDLFEGSLERIRPLEEQRLLPLAVVRESPGIDASKQLFLAETIEELTPEDLALLRWRNYPTRDELRFVCELIWTHFDGARLARGSVVSPAQLAFFLGQLSRSGSVMALIRSQAQNSQDPDRAIKQVLDFVRLWAGFHFPRLLMVVSRVARVVIARRGFSVGDFRFYAGKVENLFLDAGIAALEEYGVPLPLALKLADRIRANDGELDGVLKNLRELDARALQLSEFEAAILADAQAYA